MLPQEATADNEDFGQRWAWSVTGWTFATNAGGSAVLLDAVFRVEGRSEGGEAGLMGVKGVKESLYSRGILRRQRGGGLRFHCEFFAFPLGSHKVM